jgi:4,5:9,10-diseco-3-hydroxy-5,9,17-trioxoandrosta-1(10),2-diene-4-oate hydrolase
MTDISSELLPRGRMISVGGGQELHLNVVGEGYPLVFIHGSGPGASGWSNFKQNLPAFVERGYQCVLPDLMGYGYSSKPDTDYTLDFFVSTLTEALRKIGISRCTLVGNSMGGTISMKMALDTPDLVERLLVMAPGGLYPLDHYRQMEGIQRMLPVLTAPGGLTREALREVFKLMFFDASLLNDRLIEARFKIAQLQNDAIYKRWFIPSLLDQIGNIRQPLLGLWGMNDRFCPVESSLMLMERVKNARMVLQSACGHWFQVEHQQTFERELLTFLGARS